MSKIEEFIHSMKDKQIELHSCILKKEDQTYYQSASYPYTLDQPQMLFSVSKSFVSIAIGYLYEQNLIQLDDYVLDYFVEYKSHASFKLQQLRIVHLLTMTSGSGKEQQIFTSKNWLDTYFTTPFLYTPGTHFIYNNMDTYILSVLVSKITGVSCNEYLYQHLFKPLGIEKPLWDKCTLGYNTGGWGLYLSPNQLLTISEAIVNNHEVLPLKYLEWMFEKKVGTKHSSCESYHHGYGFLIWMNPDGLGAWMDGIFGQIVLLDKTSKSIMIVTANAIDTSELYKEVFNLWQELINNELEKEQQALNSLEIISHFDHQYIDPYLNTKYVFKTSTHSLLPLPIRFLEKQKDEAEFFKLIRNEHLTLYWNENQMTNLLYIGINGEYIESQILLYEKIFHVACSGYVNDEHQLVIKVVFLQYPYTRFLQFDFIQEKKMLVKFNEKPRVDELIDHYAYMLDFTPLKTLNTWIIEHSYHLVEHSAIAIKSKK